MNSETLAIAVSLMSRLGPEEREEFLQRFPWLAEHLNRLVILSRQMPDTFFFPAWQRFDPDEFCDWVGRELVRLDRLTRMRLTPAMARGWNVRRRLNDGC